MLQEHLQGLISRRRDRPAAPFAVMFLDFDRLKVINDSLGHHIGDQLLIAIGRRLQSCMQDEIVVPPTSTGQMVARLGGDEFVVVVEGVGSAAEASIIADRLQHRVAAPFSLQGHEAQVSASIGIVLSEAGHETPQALLRDADTAMYRAKGAGRARHVVFDREMHAQAVRRLELERELRKAVDNRELYVMYQPLIALDSGEIEGFEALARWTHPQHGAISPDEFIAVAEETGLIVPIGRKILTDSCSWIRRAIALAPPGRPPSIGVNLSKRQLAAEDLISDVADILSRSGLPPENLILEVTESTIMEHAEVFTPVLRELKKLGLRLAMDDFGTGHSSLSCLHRFPVDILKIDRAFIGNMGQSAAGLNVEYTAIVQAVITLAHNLGMRVVAEGIELPAQLVQLQSLDCDYGQGFLFSQPLSTDAAIEFIRTRPGAGLAACQPPDLRRPFDAVERGATLS
jgi:diguanylate cyclase (GGDEF)-like protein